MNPIHEIKSRLDIVQIAGEHLQLQRSGKNWKAHCPFHPDKTPSFIIFPESQRFACFGIGCQQSGDLIDLVQRVQKWDFPTTLRYLADKAGVTLRPLTEAERLQAETRQSLEQVLSAAMGYFQSNLFRPAPRFKDSLEAEIRPDLGYALGRGWSKETLAEAGIGSFMDDRESLRRCLKEAGLDMDLPAVAAFLGRRGQVAGWAAKYGLELPKLWLEQDRVPAMPGGMLIYPHLERGRVGYLAGRSIEGKSHWNPPRELVGPRQPYFNTRWWAANGAKESYALIVEGQGDALTLAHWGIPAVALAGTWIPAADPAGRDAALGRLYLVEAILSKAKTARITLALDSDEAGLEAAAKAAAQLNNAGLPADQIGMLHWPAADANAWLMEGGEAGQVQELVNESATWLDELVTRSKAAPKDDSALLNVFQAIASLPQHRVLFHREPVCKLLKIKKGYFDEMVRSQRIQKLQPGSQGSSESDNRSPYLVSDGCIYKRSYNAQGSEVLEKLCNFTSQIEQEVRRDDGQKTELEFHIGGELDGMRLPPVKIPAGEFKSMDWVLRKWGARANIEPGARRQDQLRSAIQFFSINKSQRMVFTHTGWRVLDDGRRVYLSGSGALGSQDTDVELDGDLSCYRLPLESCEPVEAMRLSLSFIDLAPVEVTAPLWASVWLAPLSEILPPDFVIWLYGRTGAFKSTLAALALNHYGAGFDRKHFPANFTDSPYRLEQKAFLAKDALLVIDDFAPQKTQRDAQDYRRTASHIIRAVGNRAGRGRLTRDLKAQRSYTPRGLVMVTGEDLPFTESLAARLFIVELKDGALDLAKLSALQSRQAALSGAMAGYLVWLAERWESHCASLPELWSSYREQATGGDAHPRLPETSASLMVGWEMGLRYAHSLGALTGDEYASLKQQGWIVLLETSEQMVKRTREERPEELFLGSLRELLAQGRVNLREKGGLRVMGGPEERAEMLGWYDEHYVYLLPEASYTRIVRHFRDQDGVFPVRQQTLRKGLVEAGYLVEIGGKSTSSFWLEGRTHRVLTLKRSVLGEDKEPGE